MPHGRKADVMAKGGGILSRLRARRIMMEGGDPGAARQAAAGKKPKRASAAASAAGLPRQRNGY